MVFIYEEILLVLEKKDNELNFTFKRIDFYDDIVPPYF